MKREGIDYKSDLWKDSPYKETSFRITLDVHLEGDTPKFFVRIQPEPHPFVLMRYAAAWLTSLAARYSQEGFEKEIEKIVELTSTSRSEEQP